MPGIDEYDWQEYVDFSGGLWERGDDRECAPNGLLECTDCFPQPSGGLRAFARFQPITLGFSTPPSSPAWVLGIWAGTAGGLGNIYMMTIEGTTSPFTFRLYAMVATAGVSHVATLQGAGTWQLIFTRTDITSIATGIRMESYHLSSAASQTYFNLPVTISVGSTAGIWRTDGSTATFAFPGGTPPFGVWTYQSRLFTVIDDGLGTLQNTIVYTEPGSSAAPPGSNFLLPFAETGGPIRSIVPFEPSDLVVYKDEYSIGTVQGPITAPTVRQGASQHTRIRNFPIRTDIGLVYVCMNEGAYVWDGQTATHVSPQIVGDPMGGTEWNATDVPPITTEIIGDLVGLGITANGSLAAGMSGHLGAYGDFVFFNNGYMMDTRTGAWFKQTSAPGARYWASDPERRLMYVSTNESFSVQAGIPSPAVLYYSMMGEGSWERMETTSFTLPLIEKPSQRVNLREIEYEVYAFNSSSTLTVEVTGPEGALAPLGPYELAAAASSVRVNVPGHPAEWYKVRTILKSNRSGDEAPMMSKMRVGTQASTRNPVNR